VYFFSTFSAFLSTVKRFDTINTTLHLTVHNAARQFYYQVLTAVENLKYKDLLNVKLSNTAIANFWCFTKINI
jgi:hypothetical protein